MRVRFEYDDAGLDAAIVLKPDTPAEARALDAFRAMLRGRMSCAPTGWAVDHRPTGWTVITLE